MQSLPRKKARPSLTDLFTDLDIGKELASSKSSPMTSPKRRRVISDRFRDTVSRRWPPQAPVNLETRSMTISADSVYRTYATDQDPGKLFDKAQNWLVSIQKMSSDIATNSEKQVVVTKELHDGMIKAIFGSNVIERAGHGWDITVQLCRKILEGEDLGPTPIPTRDEQYQYELVGWMRSLQPDLEFQSVAHILRGRNEIVQHAKALQYIIDVFAIQQQDMTEDLIKETHRILTHGVDIDGPEDDDGQRGVVQFTDYGGLYRKCIISAGVTNFTPPHFISKCMREFCEELKRDVDMAHAQRTVDPVSLGTKYSMKFVQIHPFQDGNGRTCRLILNAILFRFIGMVVALGEKGDDERAEYIGIKKRANDDMDDHGEYGTYVLGKITPRIRAMKQKLCGKLKDAREQHLS